MLLAADAVCHGLACGSFQGPAKHKKYDLARPWDGSFDSRPRIVEAIAKGGCYLERWPRGVKMGDVEGTEAEYLCMGGGV